MSLIAPMLYGNYHPVTVLTIYNYRQGVFAQISAPRIPSEPGGGVVTSGVVVGAVDASGGSAADAPGGSIPGTGVRPIASWY